MDEKVKLAQIIVAMEKLVANNKTRLKAENPELLLIQLKKQRTDLETEVLQMDKQIFALDADRQRKLREYQESLGR